MTVSYQLSLLLFVVVFDAIASNPAHLTVTPPGHHQAGSDDELKEKECYDRSNVTSGGYFKYCKNIRPSCIPNQYSSYFKSKYIDGHLADGHLHTAGITATSFADVDNYLEKSSTTPLGYGMIWDQLQRETSEEAKRCLELGAYFVCGALYPLCSYFEKENHTAVYYQYPCKSVCELTKQQCDNILRTLLGSDYHWPNIFDCESFSSDNCVQADCPDTSTSTEPSQPTPTSSQPTPSESSPQPSPSTSQPSTAQTSNPSTTVSVTVQPTQMPVKECRNCKKVRSSYSRGVLKTMQDKNLIDFLADVKIQKQFVATFEGKDHYAYNVSLIKDYDLKCNTSHYTCDDIVTIYTRDIVTEDCTCITHNIDLTLTNTYVFGGQIMNNKWILNGACIIATKRKAKTERWIHACENRKELECYQNLPLVVVLAK